jgi:glycosyltransferase involved in cell wall biosynthesis
LRLAVVSPFVDRRHGTERALAELLERLARRYHCQIHLYSQRVEDIVLDHPDAPHDAGAGAIWWHRVPSVGGPHLLQFVGWMAANTFLRWYYGLFRSTSCDLVLSPGINCLNADVILVHALFHRLRELGREETNDATAVAGFFLRLHRRVYYRLLAALERRVYSDRNVSLAAVSERTADLLGQYFLRRDVRVVPHGVDTGQFSGSERLARRPEARRRRNFRDSDCVLLLIGNDWRVKGVPAILAAMAAAPALPWRLLVAGSDARGPFREMAKHLGLLDRCQWEPPRRDVLDLYAAADIYVSPSQEDSFGLPVAEAMACGLPVITSVCAGVSGLIHDGVDGFVLRDPQDARALAALLERLHVDEILQSNVGQAAARAVQEWTWDRHAAALWELLNDALAKRRNSGTSETGAMVSSRAGPAT